MTMFLHCSYIVGRLPCYISTTSGLKATFGSLFTIFGTTRYNFTWTLLHYNDYNCTEAFTNKTTMFSPLSNSNKVVWFNVCQIIESRYKTDMEWVTGDRGQCGNINIFLLLRMSREFELWKVPKWLPYRNSKIIELYILANLLNIIAMKHIRFNVIFV